MTYLEHISYLAGLLLVGVVVFVFTITNAIGDAAGGMRTLRRRRRDRKGLELLIGGKR